MMGTKVLLGANYILGVGLLLMISMNCASCAPPRDPLDSQVESSSAASQPLEGKDRSLVWDDEEAEDVFDIDDDDAWLRHSVLLPSEDTWYEQETKDSAVEEKSTNDIDELNDDDNDEDEDENDQENENVDQFLLVPSDESIIRHESIDLKVRHNGHNITPQDTVKDKVASEPGNDFPDDEEENYDLVSYPEDNNGLERDYDDMDDHIFGDNDKEQLERTFDESTFLF